MSRVSKWKLEKTKVKVVFRLQFHATHIPQSGWDKLFISFIPADSGKATAKTTKANVRNGTCKWADPIYETTRLLQDSKSKQYDEKLYKIVVAMGSSRAGILGEATINLADYVDALKPSAVTLPLHGCNFGTILHITIQLLTAKTGFREFEQQRELREGGLQSGVDSHGHNASAKISFSEDVSNDESYKIGKSKSDANELSSVEEEVNLNEEYADSATGFDGSSNTSGSLYAEKHEHEINSLRSPHTVKEDGSNNSINNELAIACEENNRLRGSMELAESSLFNLKLEVNSLQSLADELGAETQKFSHQLASEITSTNELAKEVSVMKSECVKFKDDITRLEDIKKISSQIPFRETSDNQAAHFSKAFAVVEGKIRELQNKTSFVHHDGDTKFIYLELEALLNFLLDFKHGNTEVKEIREVSTFNDEQFVSGNGLGLDLDLSITPLVSEVANPLVAIDAMKGQIFNLVRELEDAKVEKEALIRKMDQMECYYEALIHELEENQKRMLGELQILRSEHSTCMYTLSVSKTEMESLRQDMNQQLIHFAEERRDLEAINKELERRATTSESALRRARLNYSIAVDKLQKDLEVLSSQVMSVFETNENLIKQALPLNPEDGVTRISQFQNQNVLLEDLKRSFCMQEELYHKVEKELIEMYSVNLNLDIYSKVVEQSLLEADGEIRTMKGKMDELVEELKLSTSSQDQLMLRLQKATDDIHALNEYKFSSISQCSEMALQNQLLEDKLVGMSEENYILAQKLKDSESKFAICLAENTELSLQWKREAFENERLTNEMSLLKEKVTVLEGVSDELVSSKENLEKNIDFAQTKLGNVLSSYNKQFPFLANHNLESVDIQDAILQLEEIQHDVCLKNSQLMEENQNLKSERDNADVSLSTVRSEIVKLKQTFKGGIQDMVAKLNVSNALVEKLLSQVDSVANKLQLTSETEENYAQLTKVLMADLVLLEDRMQELTLENTRDISGLDALAEEFGSSKLRITELMHDKQELATCFQDKSEESIKLNESLKNLHDELHEEKACKDELERKVKDLTFQLKQTLKGGIQDMVAKLNVSNALVEKLQSQLDSVANKLQLTSEIEENYAQLTKVLIADLVLLEDRMQELTCENSRDISGLDSLAEEFGRSKLSITELMHDKQELATCLQEKSEESIKLKESLKNLYDELHEGKACKDELERKVKDLTFQLKSDQDKLFSSEKQKVELRELASGLELEKSRLANLLGQQSVLIEELKRNHSCQASFESQLLEADIKLTYVEKHYETLIEELLKKLVDSERCIRELQKRYHDKEAVLNHSLAGEANWREEKTSFLASLNTLKSDLDAQNKLLLDSNNEITHQLKECQRKVTMMEMDSVVQTSEIERLKSMMIAAEEEINDLAISKEELEILVIVLKGKIDEQFVSITFLEDCKDKLMTLGSEYNELSKKLSEQIVKTEEFKNLSTHLKELKDKAEAECLEKRETEIQPAVAQDSLRIAFIKEQYETKIQELKQQVSISKKHGEEMLLKLQDAINEIENRKKSEAVNLKNNAELSRRLLALEEELRSAVTDKREKSNAYDRIKTELECALLSLECCKEEKEKLGACLLQCEEIKSQLSVELSSVKVQLENLSAINGSTGVSSPLFLEQDESNANSTEPMQLKIVQDELPRSNGNNLDIKRDHLGSQRLRYSMEHLNEELEKMKNENKIYDIDHDEDQGFQVPEREIIQLQKANEELSSMFPLFNERSSGGNALERVLALEIELAEALKTENKLNAQFQSSFLKQHSDEEAVFKSFRDINELIKEMLDLKGMHAAVEAELREMHDRYSQLSLQFAEVEGERQKLKMTLKNVRSSKKLRTLNRSSSANVDLSS